MVKKLFFALWLFFLSLFTNNAFGNSLIYSVEPPTVVTDTCNIPPPSNFHTTAVGYNFISVAWTSNTANADHQLTLFQKNSSNGWDSLYSVVEINSTSYTFANLTPGKTYKYHIRTICPNINLPGPASDDGGPTSLILELTTTSISPQNPLPQSQCTGLRRPVLSGEWVGFKTSLKGTNYSTLFEYESHAAEGDFLGSINRVQQSLGNPLLLAGNLNGNFPQFQQSIVGDFIFEIGKSNIGGTLDALGYLQITLYPTTVDICKFIDATHPWSPSLVFTPLLINNNIGLMEPNIDRETVPALDSAFDPYIIQNPVTDFINLYLDPEEQNEERKIMLTDMRGSLRYLETMKAVGSNILIPTSGLESGIYILTIDDSVNIKVVVSN